jgi:hypothetical protein
MPIYHCAQGILVHVFLHVFFIPPTCMYVRTNERTHSRAQIHRSATITHQEINGQAHKSEKANVDMLTEGSLIAIESDDESNKGKGEALANEEKSNSEEEEQDINGA